MCGVCKFHSSCLLRLGDPFYNCHSESGFLPLSWSAHFWSALSGSVLSGSVLSGSVLSRSALSGSAPSGSAPSGSAPSGSAPFNKMTVHASFYLGEIELRLFESASSVQKLSRVGISLAGLSLIRVGVKSTSKSFNFNRSQLP